MRQLPKSMSILGLCSLAAPAQAYEIRCRFVERVGVSDVVLQGNTIAVGSRGPRNIRVQFGVFDDAAGPAPAGGLIGWTSGSLAVSGSRENSEERRSPGRLAPFNYIPADGSPVPNGNPPLPGGDPFELLTDIDARIRVQAPTWNCDAEGHVPAAPEPRVLGMNQYISVFAFQIDPTDASSYTNYTVTAAGLLVAAQSWDVVGLPTPPDCGQASDPSDDTPGSIVYEPVALEPQSFVATLSVVVPAPSSMAVSTVALLVVARRRRTGGDIMATCR